jgi:hypothetical protein
VVQSAVLNSKAEHALEGGTFSIDTSVRHLCLLTVGSVRLDAIGRYVDGAIESEKLP